MESTSIGTRRGLSQSALQQHQKQHQQQQTTQFYHQDTSRCNTSPGSPLFPHFPPPPEYPPPGDKMYNASKQQQLRNSTSSHRYPDDPDIIEICIEPDPDERGIRNGKPRAKTRTTVNYTKSAQQMGDQPVRWSRNNIAVTMERFEPSPTSSITPPNSSSPVPTPPLPSQSYHTMHHLHHGNSASSSYPHPHEYSYAYYEPGAHMSNTMRQTTLQMAALSADPGPSRPPPPNSMRALMNTANRKNSPNNRHMYINHYGTQENVYEEIANDPRMRIMSAGSSMVSLNQSMVEEEFRRIQSRHRRILGELNLSVEAMLMPETPPSTSPTRDPDPTTHDNLTELLSQVGPTDELLSPVSTSAVNGDMDSGFSGSSSSASYVGSLRYHRTNGGGGGGGTQTRSSTPCGGGNTSSHSGSIRSSQRSTDDSGITTTASRSFSSVYEGGKCAMKKASCDDSDTTKPQKISFWSRKGWRKIPGFSSTTSVNKAGLANGKSSFIASYKCKYTQTHTHAPTLPLSFTNREKRRKIAFSLSLVSQIIKKAQKHSFSHI